VSLTETVHIKKALLIFFQQGFFICFYFCSYKRFLNLG